MSSPSEKNERINAEVSAEVTEKSSSLSEQDELKKLAADINCARTNVYIIKTWMIWLNAVLGVGTIVMVIVSALPIASEAFTIAGLVIAAALAIAMIVLNCVMRAQGPISYFQYYARSENGDKEYRYIVVNGKLQYFSDGVNTVESSGIYVKKLDEMPFSEYRHDFFLDMTVEKKREVNNFVDYIGYIEQEGRRFPVRLRTADGLPYRGVVYGTRIKYFDINNSDEIFYVPAALPEAVKAAKVHWPKVKSVEVGGERKADN